MLAWHLVGLGDFSTSCVWTVLTSMLTSSSILSKGQGTSCIIISCVVRVLLGGTFVNSCDTLLYTSQILTAYDHLQPTSWATLCSRIFEDILGSGELYCCAWAEWSSNFQPVISCYFHSWKYCIMSTCGMGCEVKDIRIMCTVTQ